MSTLAVIQIEGVLAQVHENANASKPIASGHQLFRSFKTHQAVALVSAVFDPEGAKRWLKENGFNHEFEPLDCKSPFLAMPSAAWIGQTMVETYRSQGWDIDPLVTADPTAARLGFENGVPIMLIAHPAYLRPAHRPDAKVTPRPWDSLAEEVELQRAMKRTDDRMRQEDVIGGLGST